MSVCHQHKVHSVRCYHSTCSDKLYEVLRITNFGYSGFQITSRWGEWKYAHFPARHFHIVLLATILKSPSKLESQLMEI